MRDLYSHLIQPGSVRRWEWRWNGVAIVSFVGVLFEASSGKRMEGSRRGNCEYGCFETSFLMLLFWRVADGPLCWEF